MRVTRVYSSLRRWEDDGGASLPHRRSRRKEYSLPPRACALYYFNVRRDAGAVEDDPEGLTLPDLNAALQEALALARRSLTQGDLKGQDRRGWSVEIMDRANQQLLTVAFADASYLEPLSKTGKH